MSGARYRSSCGQSDNIMSSYMIYYSCPSVQEKARLFRSVEAKSSNAVVDGIVTVKKGKDELVRY